MDGIYMIEISRDGYLNDLRNVQIKNTIYLICEINAKPNSCHGSSTSSGHGLTRMELTKFNSCKSVS